MSRVTLFSACRTVYNLSDRQDIGNGGISSTTKRHHPAPRLGGRPGGGQRSS